MSEEPDQRPITPGLAEAVDALLANGATVPEVKQILDTEGRNALLVWLLAFRGDAAKLDPHWKCDPRLVDLIVKVRNKSTHEQFRRLLGEYFLLAVEAGNGTILRQAASLIELPKQAPRMAQVYAVVEKLYCESGGRVPSKREVVEYVEAHRSRWQSLPPRDDKKAWNRIWRDSWLQEILPQGTRGPTRNR